MILQYDYIKYVWLVFQLLHKSSHARVPSPIYFIS